MEQEVIVIKDSDKDKEDKYKEVIVIEDLEQAYDNKENKGGIISNKFFL